MGGAVGEVLKNHVRNLFVVIRIHVSQQDFFRGKKMFRATIADFYEDNFISSRHFPLCSPAPQQYSLNQPIPSSSPLTCW
jgi:hypothetical protein